MAFGNPTGQAKYTRLKTKEQLDAAAAASEAAVRAGWVRTEDEKYERAKLADPYNALVAAGCCVRKGGSTWSVRQGGRILFNYNLKNGRYLGCTPSRSVDYGDSVEMLHAATGINRREARDLLLGETSSRAPISLAPTTTTPTAVSVTPAVAQPEPVVYPDLWDCNNDDFAACRKYALKRVPCEVTIDQAETEGMLEYGSGPHGRSLLFVGYEESHLDCPDPLSRTIRRITRRDLVDGEYAKMDVTGSTKAYAPIAFGDWQNDVTEDPARVVHVVESGVSGLAVQARARKLGQRVPAVIVSGGASQTGFITLEPARSVLLAATAVVIEYENEQMSFTVIEKMRAKGLAVSGPSCLEYLANTQTKTDAGHDKQRDLIAILRAVGPDSISSNRPSDSRIGDMADEFLAMEGSKILPGRLA